MNVFFALSYVVLTKNMKIAIIAGSAAHFYKTTLLRFVARNRPFHESAVNNGTERPNFLFFFFYFIFIK